jgi:hypothetical protein
MMTFSYIGSLDCCTKKMQYILFHWVTKDISIAQM